MPVLYTTTLSANGRKVMALCRHLDLDVAEHEVDVYRGNGQAPEYLAINPTGRIPALVDGDLTLTESNAILAYLAEVHGDHRLSSRDPRVRARIASWMFWESAHWQPALSKVLRDAVGHALLPDIVPAPAAPPDWQDVELRRSLARLDAQLADRAFLLGDALTIADFSVAGMTTYFRACGFPFDDHPVLAAWHARIDALPAWRDTCAELWS